MQLTHAPTVPQPACSVRGSTRGSSPPRCDLAVAERNVEALQCDGRIGGANAASTGKAPAVAPADDVAVFDTAFRQQRALVRAAAVE